MPKQRGPIPSPLDSIIQTIERGKVGGSRAEAAAEGEQDTGKTANSFAGETAKTQDALPANPQTTKMANSFAGEQVYPLAGEAANLQSAKAANSLDVKKQTVYLPKALAKRAKHYATEQECTISDVAVRALEEFLRQRGE